MYFIASKDNRLNNRVLVNEHWFLVFQMSFAYNGKNAQTKFIRSNDGILVIGANGFEFNFISDWVILS